MNHNPAEHRRWPQYRLRTLLIVVLVLSLPLSWFAVTLQRARNQMHAVRGIHEAGGEVLYNFMPWGHSSSFTNPPRWMRARLGDEFSLALCNCCFGLDANFVEFDEINDEQMSCLQKCSTLEYLVANDCQITDRGLKHLRDLTSLQFVELYGTQVTPEGIRKLQEALPNCEIEY